MLDPETSALIDRLFVGLASSAPPISHEAFLALYPLREEDVVPETLIILNTAIEERDAGAVSRGLLMAFSFGVTRQHLGTLCALATLPWHESHEAVVDAVSDLEAPEAVGPLLAIARSTHAYLRNDIGALATKCTYALRDIGTADAARALDALRRSHVDRVAFEATKQLASMVDRTDDESARVLARRLLVPRDGAVVDARSLADARAPEGVPTEAIVRKLESVRTSAVARNKETPREDPRTLVVRAVHHGCELLRRF
ncbi:hypothetical protein EON77_15140, partial [bacterium]